MVDHQVYKCRIIPHFLMIYVSCLRHVRGMRHYGDDKYNEINSVMEIVFNLTKWEIGLG